MKRGNLSALVWCAVFLACTGTETSQAQINCPSAEDALVIVQPNQPAVIHLPVVNAADSVVTVFQFPLGGALVASGPTQLDFTFSPDRTFTGRTTFSYRVSPPRGCGNGTLLRRVTLVGGTATQPVDLGGRVRVSPALCGTGVVTVSVLAFAGIGLVLFARRR
ncbi:MAG: hypothetical protein ACE5F9_13140 [Phycisphaerae bacterium]